MKVTTVHFAGAGPNGKKNAAVAAAEVAVGSRRGENGRGISGLSSSFYCPSNSYSV